MKDKIGWWITTIFMFLVASVVASFNNIIHSVYVPKSGSLLNKFSTAVVPGAGGM
jgi:hypothetical protein